MIGTTISRYDILEELGQGGMSVVYLAQDTALGREVAIKLLHEHLAKKLENRQRFRREAEAIARLRHPNILDVYDVSDESDERSFIVMEYIPGMNLRQFIDHHGPPPPEIAALLGVEICNALGHAHNHGVIHRDLKPENVMISDDGDVKLMDFGIAHVIDAETMTKTGSLLGSPAHMAPELIDGKKVDERADVFALGTVLYWMSTGQLPFCGDNAPQVLRNVMECRYEEPEVVAPTVGHDLARIICKCLNKEPENRFASVETVKRELFAAVHSVGIEETDKAVREYFADPGKYTEAYAELIVPKLIARGKQAMERKNVPVAIAHFNRVLAYDPKNEEVRECLDQLNRNQQAARFVAAAAVLLLVGVAGWWMYDMTVDEPQPKVKADVEDEIAAAAEEEAQAKEASLSAALTRVGSAYGVAEGASEAEHAAQTAVPIAQDVVGLARRVAKKGKRLVHIASLKAPSVQLVETSGNSKEETEETGNDASPPEAAEQTFEVQFKVFPGSARLEVDGEKVFWQTESIQLTRGKHVITANAPGCKPYREILVVNEPRTDKNKVPVVLEWRRATINVVSNKNALVYVAGESDPRSNARRSSISVPFRRKMGDPTKTVKLRIADASNLQRVEEREVVVRAGDSRTVKVYFP
ncbi:serine/threonine protein kinase [Persicimonas caeni]|uniref:non-specific serine/threonine protein kinase n=1 Tax=Persicimonas caeni TaxID=2292766 RepID=A0A4Y6Q2D1_PERCE|nr:serine/threonine-protein kinase [Persicimonas caeni]QDG54590.1 serine/threonine protein kinase [Persicimonas caeni]QED35811.1 serine/threonine protein kinase [Persicimonas caeni]